MPESTSTSTKFNYNIITLNIVLIIIGIGLLIAAGLYTGIKQTYDNLFWSLVGIGSILFIIGSVLLFSIIIL